jgi:hypothetical protein
VKLQPTSHLLFAFNFPIPRAAVKVLRRKRDRKQKEMTSIYT